MTNVEWFFIDYASKASIARGDLVSTDAGGMPVYEVVDVSDERVWVRDELTQLDRILPAGNLRWRMLRHPVGRLCATKRRE